MGDIIGRAYKISRANLKLVLNFLLLPTILICLARIVFVVGTSFGMKNLGYAIGGIGAILLLLPLAFWYYLKQMAMVRLFLGLETDVKKAQNFAFKQSFTAINITIAYFISLAFSTGSGAFCLALLGFWTRQHKNAATLCLGIGTSIAILVLALVLLLSFSYVLAYTSISFDNKGVLAKFGRAFGFVQRSFWRTFAFFIFAAVTVTVMSTPLYLPIWVVVVVHFAMQGALQSSSAHPGELPVYINVFSQVAESLINLVVSPIYHLSLGLYFRDLMVRQEGVDILARLEKLEAAQSQEPLS
jgi:hypothetical protein